MGGGGGAPGWGGGRRRRSGAGGGGGEGGGTPPRSVLEPPATADRALAQAERLRRHLEELVLANPLEALLEVHAAGRGELGGVVRGGRAHVGELLLLGDVDVHVVVAGVLADDLALVHLEAGPDEHGPPRLEVVDRVRGRPPGAVGDERAVLPVGDLALPVIPPVEQMVQESCPSGVGQKLGSVPDEAARRNAVLER